MNASRLLLFIDTVINLVLGCLLVTFPASVVSALGVPGSDSAFYPSILGAVLLGIGIALLIEIVKGRGLGLMGAVSINLCGGIVLGGWLLFGGLHLSVRGYVFLWALVALLVGVSAIEFLVQIRTRNHG